MRRAAGARGSSPFTSGKRSGRKPVQEISKASKPNNGSDINIFEMLSDDTVEAAMERIFTTCAAILVRDHLNRDTVCSGTAASTRVSRPNRRQKALRKAKNILDCPEVMYNAPLKT